MLTFYTNNWEIKNIDTILFDKDGTFQDDHIYWGKLAELRVKEIINFFNMDKNVFKELCDLIGYNPNTCKLIENGPVGVMSRNEVIEFMVKKLQENYDISTNFEVMSKLFDKVHNDFTDNMAKYVSFIEYSEDFIRKLKRYGLKLAVVTSDSTEHAAQVLKILKIDNCFDLVIGKDSCNKDKKTGEPAILALEKLNSKKENTLVIGDALMDYQMATNVNMKSILVATGQTNIFDLKKCTNYVVKNLREVEIKE